jgi:hypothetical protein
MNTKKENPRKDYLFLVKDGKRTEVSNIVTSNIEIRDEIVALFSKAYELLVYQTEEYETVKSDDYHNSNLDVVLRDELAVSLYSEEGSVTFVIRVEGDDRVKFKNHIVQRLD